MDEGAVCAALRAVQPRQQPEGKVHVDPFRQSLQRQPACTAAGPAVQPGCCGFGQCRHLSGGTGSGSSWASAANLQVALANTACTEVWVAAGTYTPTAGAILASTVLDDFTIRDGNADASSFPDNSGGSFTDPQGQTGPAITPQKLRTQRGDAG